MFLRSPHFLFEKLRKLHQIGEREIISLFRKHLTKPRKLPIPIGDDVSALKIGKNLLLAVTSDMLVGRTDVPPGMTLWQAARKAIMMTVSDMASKGVSPKIALCSLGLPRRLTEKDVVQIAKGLNAGAREYGAYVVGGDTNESDDLVISCSLVGICKEDEIVRRDGARPNDILAVTGLFGKTAAGLTILLRGLKAPPPLKKKLLDAVYLPKAKLREGMALAKSGALTSSIDSSDGLAWSLKELSIASRVGFTLSSLPVAKETRYFAKLHALTASDLALQGGEEFELVVTVKPDLWGKAVKAVRGVGGSLYEIGRVTKERKIVFRKGAVEKKIVPRGWEHFR